MRKSKFSETQIVGILKDAESDVPVAGPPARVRGQQGDVLQVALPTTAPRLRRRGRLLTIPRIISAKARFSWDPARLSARGSLIRRQVAVRNGPIVYLYYQTNLSVCFNASTLSAPVGFFGLGAFHASLARSVIGFVPTNHGMHEFVPISRFGFLWPLEI